MEGEESQHLDIPSTNPPMDTDHEVGDESEDRVDGAETKMRTNQCQHPRNWEAVMEKLEGLAYDDPCSDSDAAVRGVDGLQGFQLISTR